VTATCAALLAAAALALAAAGCASPGRPRLPDIPTPDMIPPGVDPAHLHFTVPAVRVGDPAPDFVLPAADGSGPVALSTFRGRPVVLLFGSCT
jgi:hypothetical protein